MYTSNGKNRKLWRVNKESNEGLEGISGREQSAIKSLANRLAAASQALDNHCERCRKIVARPFRPGMRKNRAMEKRLTLQQESEDGVLARQPDAAVRSQRQPRFISTAMRMRSE
jgi:hypothetical protein